MFTFGEPGWLVGKSAGLVIENLRVQIPSGAAGEFSSPESTLCADSCPLSVPPPCYDSGTGKDLSNSAKRAGARLHLNTRTPLT